MLTVCAMDEAESGENVREWWRIVDCGMLRREIRLCGEEEAKKKVALGYKFRLIGNNSDCKE